MSDLLHPYTLIAESIARLFAPLAEVVVHDLRTGTIAHIAQGFSKRRVGDPSLTETADLDLGQDILGPYTKTNWDGRALKSISTVLRESGGTAIGLLCINCDTTAFSAIHRQLEAFMTPTTPQPPVTALFSSDWRERINAEVAATVQARSTSLDRLTGADRQALIDRLHAGGFFEIRHAVPYIADLLGLSRATLYNRLKASRTARPKE